jgi:hypothetical protein
MNCEALAEIILDMARGTAVPEQARLGVQRHMDSCAACAAEYARQRDLTAGLEMLAAEAQEWKAPAAMKERLLAAFAAQHGLHLPVVRASSSRWRYALASAAMVMLAVWGIREAGKQEPQRPATTETPVKAGAPVAAASSTGAGLAGEAVKTQEPAFVKATTDRTAHKPRNPRTADPRPRDPRPATPVEFVRIPSAIGLPEMESGTVLRMELPLSALPEYGLDIAPDAVRSSVEADILVGQDGQPRAIRLIGRPEAVAQDPRSRQ